MGEGDCPDGGRARPHGDGGEGGVCRGGGIVGEGHRPPRKFNGGEIEGAG
ncbi:MAG: hypothetical protein K2K95_00200 [Muribaculaceae bacterium]|nr:hypothetical protein [Muribaculaceae bacterium]